ncbi:MAG: acyl-CoA dehydrogenase family protein [Mesorhizobium sp.]
MPQIAIDDPDGTLAMLRESVEAFAGQNSGPAAVRSQRKDGGHLDAALWGEIAAAGWAGLLVSEDHGGAGLGVAEQAILSEALGRALTPVPLAASNVFAAIALSDAGQSVERDRLLAGIADGSAIVAPAWQGSAHSKGRALSAKADGSGVVLDDYCYHVDGASAASDFLVIAPCGDEAVLVAVPTGAPGLTVEERAGVDGGAVATLIFDGCKADAAHVLARGKSVAALIERPVQYARLALAAELAGIASKAVELTIAYTKDRVQFGKPIASFQAIQHRMVEMWSDAEFACASVANAVNKLNEGDAAAARLAVLAAKARCGDAATSICRRAVHLHGAMGFTDEHDIGLYLKRAVSLSATLGQPERLRLEFVNLERAA